MRLVPTESKASDRDGIVDDGRVAARDGSVGRSAPQPLCSATAAARSALEARTCSPAHDGSADNSLNGRVAPTFSENRRTIHSARAEAASKLRPLRKTRSALSAEFDRAMESLGLTNIVVAERCGVTVKTIRQWRGRDLQPGEIAKPIPSDMLVHLPDELFREMEKVLDRLRWGERQAAREEALRKAGAK